MQAPMHTHKKNLSDNHLRVAFSFFFISFVWMSTRRRYHIILMFEHGSTLRNQNVLSPQSGRKARAAAKQQEQQQKKESTYLRQVVT